MDNKIYLQLKKQVNISLGQTIYLHNIAHLLCPEDIEEKIKKLIIPIEYSGNDITTSINIIEIIEIINRAIPQVVVLSVGEKQVSITISKKEPKKIDLMNVIKLVISFFLIFIGSGLAIMYFHADVNMHKVHETLTIAITGKESTSPYWINIPYSIGIGIGIALFFGIFPGKNKNPDPLEIEMFKYEKDVNSYLENRQNQKVIKNE